MGAKPPYQPPCSGTRRSPRTAGRRRWRSPAGGSAQAGSCMDGRPAGEQGCPEPGRTAPHPSAPPWTGKDTHNRRGACFLFTTPHFWEPLMASPVPTPSACSAEGPREALGKCQEESKDAPHSLPDRQARPGFPHGLTPTSLQATENTNASPHAGPKARRQPPRQN